MNKIILFFFLLLLFYTRAASGAGDIYINEILVSNTKTNLSPFGEYSDWIEIKNSSGAAIDLGGYYLTDDLTKPLKYKIPSGTVVNAGGFILFWADDSSTGVHTNFKLSKSGEALGLFRSDGTPVDTLTFGSQKDDISLGRLPGNINYWSYFNTPTPGIENSLSTTDISPLPVFSLMGGFYDGRQTLTLSVSEPADIRYTTDGTVPSGNSHLYTSSIVLDSTTAVRARSYASGKLPGEVVTVTYFINTHHTLPVFSLVTDPANFFSDTSGIYITGTNGIRGDCDPSIRNVNQDWERPVHIEMYETDSSLALSQDAGVKIFGGCSRTRYPQKSLALYARSQYGKGSFEHKLFKDKDIKKFETFILRSAADDQVRTMFRDGLSQTVVAQDPKADYQAFRPSVVYLNGIYWGIHNIREKVNEHYISGNYDLQENEINLLERNPVDEPWSVTYGSADSYKRMMNYIELHPMSNDNNYSYIQTQIDVDQYINYEIGHIYLAELDWPGNNIRFWKANSGKYSKWRWINYDMDQCFLYTTDDCLERATTPYGPSWPNPEWSTRLLRNLLLNAKFRNLFIQRYAFLMSTLYAPDNLIHIIDSLQNIIASEIPRHIVKWGGQLDPDFHENWEISPTFNSVEQWQANVDTMRAFARQRPLYATQHILNKFGISGTAVLSVINNNVNGGRINITGMPAPAGNFSGTFFKQVPVNIEAVPAFGYKFSHWETGSTTNSNTSLDVTLTEDLAVTAYFEPVIISDTSLIIINEINYNSAKDFDSGDWIELYNRQSSEVDLSWWYIQNENNEKRFVFPANTKIPGHGYLVVNGNSYDFHSVNPAINNYTGDFKFSLSGKGEVIELFSGNGMFIDSVHYDNNYPWPEAADGKGATLELRNTSLDNDSASNWAAAAGIHGTPGMPNTVTGIDDEYVIPAQYNLYQNYPNPFNPVTKIKYAVGAGLTVDKTTIKVYDLLGKELVTLVNEYRQPGIYEVEFNASSLASGVYFYRMLSGSFVKTMKLIVIK